MDYASAVIRALRAGINDGVHLSFGAHKPTLGGELIELQYLRGFAIGVEKWKTQQPAAYELFRRLSISPLPGQPVGVELGDHLIAVLDTTVQPPQLDPAVFLPHSWPLPAILPDPSIRVARPPRHTVPADDDFFVRMLPQIPLPEDVDRDKLTVAWGREQQLGLFNFQSFGCWIAVESSTTNPVHTSRTTATISKIGATLFPGDPALCIHQPIALVPRFSGVVFVHGTREQIHRLVWGKVLATPEMCLLVFPNRPRRSTFVCTFESKYWSRPDGDAVTRSIRRALESCAKVVAHCVDCNRVPDIIFASIELEYVFDGRRHLWNLSMDPPTVTRSGIKSWRSDISRLMPEDGNGGVMYAVKLECDICGCVRHIASLCPTGAYEEWTGAIVA